jgi:hypothetical protein
MKVVLLRFIRIPDISEISFFLIPPMRQMETFTEY